MAAQVIQLTPSPGVGPTTLDALLVEMQRHADQLGEVHTALDHLARRSVRIETRLVKLMEHHGLTARGAELEPA